MDDAVLEDYPLDRARTQELLDEALAAEIMCVLAYRHHQVVTSRIGFPQVAAELAQHADAEHVHMMAFADRIAQLGGDPDFNTETVATRAAMRYGSGRSLVAMIENDLVAEEAVIQIHWRMIAWFGDDDPTSRRSFEGILADEEDHANDLGALLATLTNRTA